MVILIMLWLYFVSCMIFVGAQINEYLNQAGLNVDTAEHEETGEMEIAEAETLDLSEEGVEEITEDALEEIDLLEDLEPTSEEPQA